MTRNKGRENWEKRGPKPKLVKEEDLKLIETLAAQGVTDAAIAAQLGMAPCTFYERKREMPEITAALSRGRSSGATAISGKLFQMAMAGDFRAIALYLKCQAGWSERHIVEHQGSVDNPVRMKLEGLSREDLMQRYQELKAKAAKKGKADE